MTQGLETPHLSIAVCLCSFRRPQVVETLQSLASLEKEPHWTLQVIVADNDDTSSAQELIETTGKTLGLDLLYVHAPSRNISIARNACLENARADFIAMIDDDERASPKWLKELVTTALLKEADIVLGPVLPLFAAGAPSWAKKGEFFETFPVWVHDKIQTGYSCNVLFRPDSPCLKGLSFDVDLGKSGGEDTLFFGEAFSNGAKIVFAEKAVVTETVPPERVCFSWLARRRFRSGQSFARLRRLQDRSSVGKTAFLAFLKAAFCLPLAFLLVFWTEKRIKWLCRACLHAGVLAGSFGMANLEQYGKDTSL